MITASRYGKKKNQFHKKNRMYSRLQLAKKYLEYYISAKNGKGHGVHSPFVFDFITKVLNDYTEYPCYSQIEKVRKEMLQTKTTVQVEDFGAGSVTGNIKERKVSTIASSALKPKKFSQLLFRIAQYYKTENIIELGTSLGITTSYLASAYAKSQVTTMEGSENIASLAKSNFSKLNLKNIKSVVGNFDEILQPYLLQLSKPVDLAFIDGNHRKQPTIDYFNILKPYISDNSILIFDDIHWSAEMEEAWKVITGDASVTLSIDLFFIGIVFFRKEQKSRQQFIIRF